MSAEKKLNYQGYNELIKVIFPDRIRIPRSPLFNALTFNQLQSLPTIDRTRKMYKLIKSYDAGGDLSKEWFVKYHFLKPDILCDSGGSEYERFKISGSINCIHSKIERRKQLLRVKRGIKLLLNYGFNPYEEFDFCSKVTYSGTTVYNSIDKYFIDIEPNVKASTLRKYKTNLNLFKRWLMATGRHNVQIYNAKKELVYTFLKHYQSPIENGKHKGWANKTYNHYLNSIHAFFEHFKDNYDDLVINNPAKTLKRLQVSKKGNRPFDNYEFNATLEYMKENNQILYNFFRFSYYSCFRPDAEGRLIKISDIDLFSRRIRIGEDITKGKATQVIPIDDEFANFLVSLDLLKYPRHYYVFGKGGSPGETPAHAKYFSKIFKPVKTALGLHPNVNLYSAKHTRAIHMMEDGEDLFNIIKFTRHKSLANLMDYLKDMGVIIGETKKFKSRKI